LTGTSVNNFFDLAASPKLKEVLDSFIYSSVHKSPKTIQTLHETLGPFVDYLLKQDIDNHLAIKRQHVEGFIREISQGRKGKPLSPSSVFAFTKDIRAFINYVADEWSPEEWPNPVQRIKCARPQVFIRPLSREQLVRLFELAKDTAPTQIIASRNRAMLLTLIDEHYELGN
jgi:site-specific recombinase XerD